MIKTSLVDEEWNGWSSFSIGFFYGMPVILGWINLSSKTIFWSLSLVNFLFCLGFALTSLFCAISSSWIDFAPIYILWIPLACVIADSSMNAC